MPRLASGEAVPWSHVLQEAAWELLHACPHIHTRAHMHTHVPAHTDTHTSLNGPLSGACISPCPTRQSQGGRPIPGSSKGVKKPLNSPTPTPWSVAAQDPEPRAAAAGPSSVAMDPMDLGGQSYRQRLTVLRNQGHREPGDRPRPPHSCPRSLGRDTLLRCPGTQAALPGPLLASPMLSSWAGEMCTGGWGPGRGPHMLA